MGKATTRKMMTNSRGLAGDYVSSLDGRNVCI